MDWKLFAQLIVTFVVAAIGWWVGHSLTSRRDLANERRKLRITYLIEAYRRLEEAVDARNPRSKWKQLEAAIADIQLFGTPAQVKMAADFSHMMAANSNADLRELLIDLRRSLRSELQIAQVEGNIIYLRFEHVDE
jgi:hypothetical protein